jgi:hypothetical protein
MKSVLLLRDKDSRQPADRLLANGTLGCVLGYRHGRCPSACFFQPLPGDRSIVLGGRS